MTARDERKDQKIDTNERARFEGIRQLAARIDPALGKPATGGELLDAIEIACQAGSTPHSGAACKQCARFVNWVPSPDRSAVTIRCLWRESDRVGDLMALIPVLVTVPPYMLLSEASAMAHRLQVPYLLVEQDKHFEGVIYLCDMFGPGRVRQRMLRPTWSVEPTATLGDVVAIMQKHGTDFVPVVSQGLLQGLITRADLMDAGLDVGPSGACVRM